MCCLDLLYVYLLFFPLWLTNYQENAHSFWIATIKKAQKTTGGERM